IRIQNLTQRQTNKPTQTIKNRRKPPKIQTINKTQISTGGGGEKLAPAQNKHPIPDFFSQHLPGEAHSSEIT
ncbi:hypothetical protein, partial [Pseudovibrio flavus]|uniref:hypothetical protein n=1 Tax=Pseudovibrio flavus TaxID=2529854 RepID=UPI00211B87B2